MATKLKKVGYGQCEARRISAQRTKEIYSTLPLADGIVAECGMALVVDFEKGEVRFSAGAGDKNALFGLVYPDMVMEDERAQADRDFYMTNVAASDIQGAVKAYPKLLGFTRGDIFVLNTIETDDGATLPAKGSYLSVGTNGYWTPYTAVDDFATAYGPVVKVIEQTTVPDRQPGVKVEVVRA